MIVWELFAWLEIVALLLPATLRRLTFKSFLATYISFNSLFKLSLTLELFSSSSGSSKLTLLRLSPISECVIKPEVREILTDCDMEFICSDRYSETVWKRCQEASLTARGSSDLLSAT